MQTIASERDPRASVVSESMKAARAACGHTLRVVDPTEIKDDRVEDRRAYVVVACLDGRGAAEQRAARDAHSAT